MSEAISNIATALLEALSPILVAAVVALVVQWFRKMGLEVSAQQQARLEHYTQLAILEAEEWARKQAKQTGTTPSSDDKLSLAAERISEAAHVPYREAIVSVHSQIASVGLGAVVEKRDA